MNLLSGRRFEVAACGEGASPLPGLHPPERFPPRSPVRVIRGTVQIRHPAPGFVRSGFQNN